MPNNNNNDNQRIECRHTFAKKKLNLKISQKAEIRKKVSEKVESNAKKKKEHICFVKQ